MQIRNSGIHLVIAIEKKKRESRQRRKELAIEMAFRERVACNRYGV